MAKKFWHLLLKPRKQTKRSKFNCETLPLEPLFNFACGKVTFIIFFYMVACVTILLYHLTDDLTQDRLEELEDTDYLYIIRQKIPKISDLSSRLKTKLVQDPLVLDSQGNLLVEENVLRSVVSRLTRTGRVLKKLLRDWCANEYYWVVSDLVTV